MVEQIIPSDPLARTRLVLTIVLTLTLGLAAVIYSQAYIDTMIALRPVRPRAAAAGLKQLHQLLAVCSMILGTSVAGLIANFSFRISRSGQAPPAGMRVAFATKIRTGKSARIIANSSLVLAVGVFLGCLLLGYYFWTVGQAHEVIYPGPFQKA